MWTVGQLSQRVGLTVRTLHHWDAIGLLEPADRSESGYRHYGEDELRRLYAIVALRALGLPLADIAARLDGAGGFRAAVEAQLEHVARALADQRRLHARLVVLRTQLARGDEPSIDELTDLIEVTMTSEQYYTTEQREAIAARGEALGAEGLRKAEEDWATLIAEAERLRAEGADTAGPEVADVVRRWNALIDAFTGGDPGIRDSVKRMYEEEGPEQASHGAVKAELLAWLATAPAAR